MTNFESIDLSALDNVTGGTSNGPGTGETDNFPGLIGRVIGCGTNSRSLPEFGRCVMTGKLPPQQPQQPAPRPR